MINKRKAAIKNIILVLLLVLASASVVYADVQDMRIAVIDTGISSVAVSEDSIGEGYNYVSESDNTEDKIGHGTAIAAFIVGSEKARIDGICTEAKLVPLVWYSEDDSGKEVKCDADTLAQIIQDAVDVYQCRIINVSLGTTEDNASLKAACDYAYEKGVLIISSAGNSYRNNPGQKYFPGSYDNVLCVGSCNSDGTIADFSQRGKEVEIYALGSDLRLSSVKGTRIRGEGTSYSTAMIAGVAANIRVEHPEYSVDQVKDALISDSCEIEGYKVLSVNGNVKYEKPDDEPAAEEEITELKVSFWQRIILLIKSFFGIKI